jgi:hypothetical protein
VFNPEEPLNLGISKAFAINMID